MSTSQWYFEDFCLDLTHICLWRGTTVVPLPPKAFDVLHYLVTHPDRVVTKDELLDAVWSQTAVSEAAVRVAIGVLRKALDDTAQPPRYIATVARRGYRFVAMVTAEGPGVPVSATAPAQEPRVSPLPPGPGPASPK
jgi:DNA-binding winged helix-turn-helix (wHTH) protein